jgi:hypothetical protein
VPKYAILYNNQLVRLEGELLGIKDALEGFDYEELLNQEV